MSINYRSSKRTGLKLKAATSASGESHFQIEGRSLPANLLIL